MRVRWETAAGQTTGLAALLALAFTLGGCSAVSNETACKKQGLAEGTPAFSECVADKKATTALYRNQLIRHGGAGR